MLLRYSTKNVSCHEVPPCHLRNSLELTSYVIVGWGRATEDYEQQNSVKRQIIQLIVAVRTLMRSTKLPGRLLLTFPSSTDHYQCFCDHI